MGTTVCWSNSFFLETLLFSIEIKTEIPHCKLFCWARYYITKMTKKLWQCYNIIMLIGPQCSNSTYMNILNNQFIFFYIIWEIFELLLYNHIKLNGKAITCLLLQTSQFAKNLTFQFMMNWDKFLNINKMFSLLSWNRTW